MPTIWIRSALSAALLLSAGPGLTPVSAATQSIVAVTGKVNTTCTFNGSGNSATLTFSVTVAANGNTPGAPSAQSIPNIYCNKPATLVVASTSLRLFSPAPATSLNANQTQTINVTATASGTGVTSASVTTADPTRVGSTTQYTGTGVSQNPIRSTAGISVALSALNPQTTGGNANTKLVQGTYRATVVVTLTAN